MTDLHMYFRLGLSTVSNIIREVCKAIWQRLKGTYLCVPDTEKWKTIAEEFYMRANYPNCFGALDGKHVRVIKPEHSGSMYYNYKHFFSVVLLAMCDSNYLFTYVDIGEYGKKSDSGVFKDSTLWEAIKNNALNLPSATPLPASGDIAVPYVIVADEAFGLSDHVMRPFGKKHLTEKRKVYNYRHSRARRYIECTFGIMSNTWRIFHRPMNVGISLAEDIIKASCILHNYVRSREGIRFEETLNIYGLQDLTTDTESRGTIAAIRTRDKFADYFVSEEGALTWQNLVI